MITQIISVIENISGLPVIPLQSDKLQEQIIYTPTPISDDGVVNQYQLKLNIITTTLAKADEKDIAIRNALIDTGDKPKINSAITINLNGGGTLVNGEYIHRFINLVIKETR